MTNPVRRRLLQAAAGSLALAGLRGVAAADNAAREGAREGARFARLSDIDHIIILMKENRSFDHYFGTLGGVRGFGDTSAATLGSGLSVFHQPDSEHADGYRLPFHLDTGSTRAQHLHVLDHSWGGLHEAWNGGAMDRWISSRRRLNGAVAPLAMGYHTRRDLPFYYALADAFTVCDAYHASMLGPTHPNRSFLWTGSVDPEGHAGGPMIDNQGRGFGWETYPERLEAAGISWRIYHARDDYGCNQCRYFARYANLEPNSALFDAALRDRPIDELLDDLKRGNIPQVTWIIAPSTASEHPEFTPAAGEDFTQRILAALWSNPTLWSKTAFILNFDENDGQFDHVAPPTPEPGTPGEFVNGLPIGLGFRVPCVVISPFARGGNVCSDTFDHTSTLRLIEARFGVEIPNLSAWRRQTCGDLTGALGIGRAAPDFTLPEFPTTAERAAAVEREAATLPAPVAPEVQLMPIPEAGLRPRRGVQVT